MTPKSLCRCGHPVASHDVDPGCRRGCGCRRTRREAAQSLQEVPQ